MKQFWVDCRPWNKECATTAIESGADAIVAERAGDVKRLGRITTVAPDGDLVYGKDVIECTITDKASENEAAQKGKNRIVIVTTSDWTVIPLENLVAQSDRIIAAVKNVREAELALHVLEKGVYGILLKTTDPAVVKAVAALIKNASGSVQLVPFTVTKIQPVGMGDRVCVDTCSMLADGDGMLMGNTSSAMLLVHAETLENPYVAPRPFRVNAGAVHAYILLPDGKTAYLSDLCHRGPGTCFRPQGRRPVRDRGQDKDRAPAAASRRSAGRSGGKGKPHPPERGDDPARGPRRERNLGREPCTRE